MRVNNGRVGIILVLQLMNILYSLNSVLVKMVSVRWEKDGLFGFSTLSLLIGAVLIMAVYALLWQKILSKVELTVAYMCKGMIIFWGFLFFGENISLFNVIGTLLIFTGTYLVTANE